MTVVSRINGDLQVAGNISLSGSLSPAIARDQLAQDDLTVYPVPFTDLRVHDALQTVLPGTSASDDLGLYGGTFGTSQPLVRTYDVKTAGAVTLYARTQIPLPAEYQDGETVQIRVSAGMVTTVADVSATVDVQAYKIGKDNSLGSDICATSATTMNSLVFADKTFTITPTTLAAGDVLDVRLAIAVNDAATVTAVIAALAAIDLLCDVKG